MVSISIVVGLGCYGGIPNNRAEVSKLEAIPLKEFEDKPSGFDPRTSTNCGFVRTRKPQGSDTLRLLPFLQGGEIMRKNEDIIFMTRDFWREMNVPRNIVSAVYNQYLGNTSYVVDNRAEAIEFITQIVTSLRNEILDWFKANNSNQAIKDLYYIFDVCFKFYMAQKNARKKIVELNINDDDIINEFSKNRNMCVNVINSINLWIENSLLLQNSIDDPLCNCESKVDAVLFVRVYLYGLASKALSLLALSKKYGETELFYGIRISPNEDEPIEVIRYHPVIYFNPSLIGNQDSFQLDITDYQNIDSSTFGMGFQSLHNSSLLISLRAMSTFQTELLKDGKYSHVVISKARFIALVNKYTSGQVDGECFFNAFVLTKDKVTSQLKGEETIIWMMGVNKYRHELRPFICLDNNTIAISYMALEQAKHIWLSYFANGGMIYTNTKDELTAAIEERNTELSKLLVEIIRDKLQTHYDATFNEIDVKYSRIFGDKDYDYGDYDLVFYTQERNELFLIEAKFFSDSLNNSGIINDYHRLFKENGYYTHCRKRCDLAIAEAEKLKDFIGINGTTKTHFLFVSSKPLEIEFTDKDGIVSFPCLSILDDYLIGNLISEDGSDTIRPTYEL